MALYHLSTKVIKRSEGRNAVEAAAYRSGLCLYDDTTGQQFDYSKKKGVVHSEILLPESAPERFRDRQCLWKEVETVEKRKDSQLAREIDIALPNELNRAQQIALVREFVELNFTLEGMIVDCNLHVADINQTQNDHAHLQMTMRELNASGFGLKQTSWNDKKCLIQWRESWADLVNKYLHQAGFEEFVDHRSYKDQGVDLLPTVHLGHNAFSLESKGVETEVGKRNKLAIEYNEYSIQSLCLQSENHVSSLLSRLQEKSSKKAYFENPKPIVQIKARFQTPTISSKKVGMFEQVDDDFFYSWMALCKPPKKVMSLRENVLELYDIDPFIMKAVVEIAKEFFHGEFEITGRQILCSNIWCATVYEGCSPIGYTPTEKDWQELEARIANTSEFETSRLAPFIREQLQLNKQLSSEEIDEQQFSNRRRL